MAVNVQINDIACVKLLVDTSNHCSNTINTKLVQNLGPPTQKINRLRYIKGVSKEKI